jgi:predicted component of type VI protein secretion system
MKRFLIAYKNTSIEAPEGEFVIGRSEECHLVLEDPSVSRVHAAIVRNGDELRVEDRGSRNGVRVNRVQIKEPTVLKDKDQVIIGHQLIRIIVSEKTRGIEKTQGIVQCSNCGAWVSGNAAQCSHCGTSISMAAPFDATETRVEAPDAGRAPFSTLAQLAEKALQVDKVDEADRLAQSMLASAFSVAKSGTSLTGSDLAQISAVLVSLAEASKAPAQISHLFSIHLVAKKLMSRELVETLYNLVRGVGYLACPEMTRYLSFLDSREKSFSPGERFVHRRLQGLVKLCS